MKQKFAAISLSAAALVGIALHEGYSPTPYYATEHEKQRGILTCDFGDTLDCKPGQKSKVETALVKLLNTTDQFQAELAKCISDSVEITQGQHTALMSWAYNVGTTNACKSTLVRKLNAGQEWCSELLRWDRQNGQVLPGLTKRRQAEYQQCVS